MRLFRQVKEILSSEVIAKKPSATAPQSEKQTPLTRYLALGKSMAMQKPSYYDFEEARDELVQAEQSGKIQPKN